LKFLEAEFTLDVGSGSHGTLTGEMMIGIEGGLEDEKLDVVLVEGDTNMVLAGGSCCGQVGGGACGGWFEVL
jgi:UDP-N-acetylglucosamine 2-epimerase (non-hydrolysing)